MSAGKLKGFTLIELLIVVAIIAILAAIAVPNFLEAQTRSKVSRVKADMRSIATAVESYYIDYNRYPITGQWVDPARLNPSTFNNRLRGITTPVAFMTSLPLDTFRELDVQPPITPGQKPTFEYTDFSTAVAGQNFPGIPNYNLFTTQSAFDLYYTKRTAVGLKWTMFSVGPDRKSDYQQGGGSIGPVGALELGVQRTYDPTNGTISIGDIARTALEQRN